MEIGIFAKTFVGDTPARVLAAAGAAGYRTVQYNMACSGLSPLPAEVPDSAAEAVAAASEETGVGVAAVSATYNMVHPDTAKREAGRRSFAAIAAAAPRMGCRLVTVCSGSRNADDQWSPHPDNDTAAAWAEMVAEFRLIVPVAEKHGVLIGVEPELANVVSTPARARTLLDLFASGPIRIVLDPANLFERGTTESVRGLVEDAVSLVGTDIALAHAKDRSPDGDVAAAGAGAVDWDHYFRVLRAAGFDGPVVTHGLEADEAASVARFLHAKTGG